jgi:ribonuclease R
MSLPLPRREAIIELLASRDRALPAREIAARLHVPEHSFPGFSRLLESLGQEGAIVALSGTRYAVQAPVGRRPDPKSDERTGTLSTDPRGFGFVRAVGFADDLYVPDHAMGGAIHGDTVVARVVRRNAVGPEGEVLRVVSRKLARVAGVLRRRGRSTWLEPDDSRIRGPIVLKAGAAGADGDAAVVTITRFPVLHDENPEGELVCVLGVPGDPKVEVAKVLIREAVDESHPEDAVREARAFGETVAPEALEGREDLTGVPLPTIDPEDARDHDDAVWVERAEDGTYTAWIAIADVSHYVRPGTALDEAAKARGCSVYLPDRAIPMLPRELSSNLCSLLPGVIRLCLCAIVKLDAGANVLSTRVVKGYMNSVAKLTYPGVARALGFTQKPKVQKAAEDMLEGLKVADTLSQMLRTKRMKRGALDFNLPEPKVILDTETGAPIGVERRAEDPGVRRAYQLIEELMLLANEVMAKFLVDRGVPAIFRVHARPDETKLERFAKQCDQAGLTFDSDDAADPKKLSLFLRKVAKHPRADVLNMLLLRSMKQASYDIANIGHFGLASPAYLHFTSPIRRYPDTAVHRIVKMVLDREDIDRSDEAQKELSEAARIASERERKAMEVEREIVDLYRALYMRGHIGETFEGTVTGMVGAGVFVSLDSPFCDVMVRAEGMGKDRYELDEDAMRFVAKRSGDAISLGDRMIVTIEDVQILRRTVYAWRHSPDLADREPLRQKPFEAKPRGKRARGEASAPSTPAPPSRESARKPTRRPVAKAKVAVTRPDRKNKKKGKKRR